MSGSARLGALAFLLGAASVLGFAPWLDFGEIIGEAFGKTNEFDDQHQRHTAIHFFFFHLRIGQGLLKIGRIEIGQFLEFEPQAVAVHIGEFRDGF